VLLGARDVTGRGFGTPWGHTRTYSNNSTFPQNLGNGWNWKVDEWPYLVYQPEGQVTVVLNANRAYWFQLSGATYVSQFPVNKETLTYDAGTKIYRLTLLNGAYYELDGQSQRFLRYVERGGAVTEVTSFGPDGVLLGTVERSYTAGGSTVVEQLAYDYSDVVSQYAGRVLGSVTLRRKVDAGAWLNVEKAVYTYYGYTAVFGIAGDLQTVTTQQWDGSAWYDTGTSYYRYYLHTPDGSGSDSSSGSSGGGGSPRHLLKFVLGPAAFERLKNDPNVSNPLTAPDLYVALYADNYFEYDPELRVTKEIVQGGSQTYLFAYEESGYEEGYNSWSVKTTETRPDGSQRVVYSNFAFQTMLSVLRAPEDLPNGSTVAANEWDPFIADQGSAFDSQVAEWISFYQYDAQGFVVRVASPAAVTGYDESTSDLLDYDSLTGKYAFLRDHEGLITLFEIDPCSGYVARESCQAGQLGTPILLREFEFTPVESGSSSASSSSGCPVGVAWVTARETLYPSAEDPDQKIITTYDYTFYAGTSQIQQRITTLPAIPLEQNGTGVSATTRDYHDEYGNLTWTMNERGYITRMMFDIPTGALIQRIQDVDTSIETDAPAGWTTPPDGGLNLITDYEHDSQGRTTQILGPAHEIDLAGTATVVRRATWFVYAEDSATNILRTASGYATGSAPTYTYILINPVSITVNDKSDKLQEQIAATRASTSGKLSPGDTFAQSSYVRWLTLQYTDCCHVASERAYCDIPGSGAGTEGTNYNQTDYGYDVMKRRIRTVTPGGTITRTVLDVRGLVSQVWVGTNDEGATADDPGGEGDPDNNMVIVTANVYDNGEDGGNGVLTQQTQYAAASDTRVTTFTYDFRDRPVTTDGELDFFQKTDYDTLNRTVQVDRYDTTSSGHLIARHQTRWNDRGKIYQRVVSGVDPATGTVGNALTDNFWFDAALLEIQSLPAGSKLFTRTTYDSLGRRTAAYVGYTPEEGSSSGSGSGEI
jgi:hypothetical protein